MSTKSAILLDVLEDGEILEMLDGSRWLVNPGDMSVVCTWTPTATITISESNEDRGFRYVLTNDSNGDSVHTMKLH